MISVYKYLSGESCMAHTLLKASCIIIVVLSECLYFWFQIHFNVHVQIVIKFNVYWFCIFRCLFKFYHALGFRVFQYPSLSKSPRTNLDIVDVFGSLMICHGCLALCLFLKLFLFWWNPLLYSFLVRNWAIKLCGWPVFTQTAENSIIFQMACH